MLSMHNSLVTMRQCVVLDIETTGFSPRFHSEIIEIGAVKLDILEKKVIGKFNHRIQPSETFAIPKKITDITGIAWSDVDGKPYIEQILPDFSEFIDDLPVIAHNAEFDWARFLIPAFQTVGLHKMNDCICTMLLAKDLFPDRGKGEYNLESLCHMYGYEIKNHHNAYADARTTASLFLKLLAEYRRRNRGNRGEAHTCEKAGTVDFRSLLVRRISSFTGTSKRHGPKIFVTTNFGRIAYSVRRKVWTCVDLWTNEDAPVEAWGQAVLDSLKMDIGEFERRYAYAG